MTQRQRNIWNLRKMKHKKISFPELKDFSLLTILKSSARFVLLFKSTMLVWCLINFVLLYIFSLIPNGWRNSLSILWLVCYYVFWNIFIRYILQHRPYFSLIRIFNGLIPSSKIMFINIAIYILIVVIPYIPLFMGFRDKYLEFFESYMQVFQSPKTMLGKSTFYCIMLLISPYTIIRPYLAYIASLVSKSRSIMDAYKRSKGFYWCFVLYSFIMSVFFVLSYYIDTTYNINTLIYTTAILTIYFNIVFIGIYKCFYKRRARAKTK